MQINLVRNHFSICLYPFFIQIMFCFIITVPHNTILHHNCFCNSGRTDFVSQTGKFSHSFLRMGDISNFFQAGNYSFNRAQLINIGFLEAVKISDFECFVFHDVDHILENDQNNYECPESPKLLGVSIDRFNRR